MALKVRAHARVAPPDRTSLRACAGRESGSNFRRKFEVNPTSTSTIGNHFSANAP